MVTEDQSEVIAFLSQPSTHDSQEVERIDTHASIVFLAGDHALKLKRAVRYDYLDFSTREIRRLMCEKELILNRRTAPAIYEQVAPITREADGRLALAGRGAAVDWLVRMRRFDQDALLDRLAERGALPLSYMASLGEAIGRLHRQAEPRSDHGGVEGMRRVVTGNARSFEDAPEGLLDRVESRRIVGHQMRLLEHHAPRLEARRQQGYVRYCHGDLHLRNLVLLEGTPTLFDGIEFNEDLACIDVHYDLAFLLMDLWRRGLRQHANAAWNAYLASTIDFGGLPLSPLFLSCRAAIRAKTSLTTASLADDDSARTEARRMAREYLTLAGRLLAPEPSVLIAIGGLSGSGKSTVASALASHVGGAPGAVVVRSDVIRKWLSGVEPTARLGPASYNAEQSQRVYEAVVQRCRVVADTGHAAVADAVFGHAAQRDAIRACAAGARVPFVGVWLDAPRDVLLERVAARTGDASDADGDVVVQQSLDIAPPVEWAHVDAGRPLDEIVADVLRLVRPDPSAVAGAPAVASSN